MLIATQLEDGSFPPMGADVVTAAGDSVGMVGQGGQIYARLAEERGTLQVVWGPQAGEQCAVSYRLPSRGSDAFTHLELPCQLRRSP
ncbi:FimD/PapC C-terminal domain-containing protein [Symbiopectobacterium sp. Eva_TO]